MLLASRVGAPVGWCMRQRIGRCTSIMVSPCRCEQGAWLRPRVICIVLWIDCQLSAAGVHACCLWFLWFALLLAAAQIAIIAIRPSKYTCVCNAVYTRFISMPRRRTPFHLAPSDQSAFALLSLHAWRPPLFWLLAPGQLLLRSELPGVRQSPVHCTIFDV
jgi:hypothetical protein